MNKKKEMASRVARKVIGETESDESLRNVDEAVDNIVASLIAIEENLPAIKADTVHQKAALDRIDELMNKAVVPYFADVVNALKAFD
jgi:hypothetical protein